MSFLRYKLHCLEVAEVDANALDVSQLGCLKVKVEEASAVMVILKQGKDAAEVRASEVEAARQKLVGKVDQLKAVAQKLKAEADEASQERIKLAKEVSTLKAESTYILAT